MYPAPIDVEGVARGAHQRAPVGQHHADQPARPGAEAAHDARGDTHASGLVERLHEVALADLFDVAPVDERPRDEALVVNQQVSGRPLPAHVQRRRAAHEHGHVRRRGLVGHDDAAGHAEIGEALRGVAHDLAQVHREENAVSLRDGAANELRGDPRFPVAARGHEAHALVARAQLVAHALDAPHLQRSQLEGGAHESPHSASSTDSRLDTTRPSPFTAATRAPGGSHGPANQTRACALAVACLALVTARRSALPITTAPARA